MDEIRRSDLDAVAKAIEPSLFDPDVWQGADLRRRRSISLDRRIVRKRARRIIAVLQAHGWQKTGW